MSLLLAGHDHVYQEWSQQKTEHPVSDCSMDGQWGSSWSNWIHFINRECGRSGIRPSCRRSDAVVGGETSTSSCLSAEGTLGLNGVNRRFGFKCLQDSFLFSVTVRRDVTFTNKQNLLNDSLTQMIGIDLWLLSLYYLHQGWRLQRQPQTNKLKGLFWLFVLIV